MSKLSNKQLAFIAAYLGPANFNANEAARLAGYSPRNKKVGYDVLRSPAVAAQIREALRKRHVSTDEVLARLSDVARCSLDDFVSIDEATGKASIDLRKARDRGVLHTFESVQVTSQGDIRIKRYNALNALERLARIDKRYTERLIQMDAKVLNTIIDALPPECRENVVMALQTMFPGGEEKPEEEFEDNGVGDEPNEYLLN